MKIVPIIDIQVPRIPVNNVAIAIEYTFKGKNTLR